jgi:hypothetical protein
MTDGVVDEAPVEGPTAVGRQGVFSDGALTLVVTRDGVRAYAGVHEVRLSTLKIVSHQGVGVVVEATATGGGLEREEGVRLLAALGFVK